jgi:hypothetical protein
LAAGSYSECPIAFSSSGPPSAERKTRRVTLDFGSRGRERNGRLAVCDVISRC